MADTALKWEHCWRIFNESIEKYHIKDDVDQPDTNPYETESLDGLLYAKNWVDTVQWHLEDIVRSPDISDEKIAEIKRRIDKSNQVRTDIVEKLDDWIIDHFKNVTVSEEAKLNTESPAWVLDRMSILALKIYHMQEQVDRTDVDADHKQKCQAKLDVLLEQKYDLGNSFDELMLDVAKGLKRVKVYRQMKMYNDEKLNPILYKKSQTTNP